MERFVFLIWNFLLPEIVSKVLQVLTVGLFDAINYCQEYLSKCRINGKLKVIEANEFANNDCWQISLNILCFQRSAERNYFYNLI